MIATRGGQLAGDQPRPREHVGSADGSAALGKLGARRLGGIKLSELRACPHQQLERRQAVEHIGLM
jgi:hypothetical protein